VDCRSSSTSSNCPSLHAHPTPLEPAEQLRSHEHSPQQTTGEARPEMENTSDAHRRRLHRHRLHHHNADWPRMEPMALSVLLPLPMPLQRAQVSVLRPLEPGAASACPNRKSTYASTARVADARASISVGRNSRTLGVKFRPPCAKSCLALVLKCPIFHLDCPYAAFSYPQIASTCRSCQ